MPEKLSKIVNYINSAWGILVIIAFFIGSWYTLGTDVRANGEKTDLAIRILQKQTELLANQNESLKDKSRDHITFAQKQDLNLDMQRDIVRLMDRVVILMERK